MLASFIMCQACGCRGRAGNTLAQNQSESPVFRYHGHDPFEGTMRYSCANCKATLVVDPMDMLTSFCAPGVPEFVTPDKRSSHQETSPVFHSGKFLQRIVKRTTVSKYH